MQAKAGELNDRRDCSQSRPAIDVFRPWRCSRAVEQGCASEAVAGLQGRLEPEFKGFMSRAIIANDTGGIGATPRCD
jgi:hypothetical protein